MRDATQTNEPTAFQIELAHATFYQRLKPGNSPDMTYDEIFGICEYALANEPEIVARIRAKFRRKELRF